MGYAFKLMGGCDKQGFPMKEGVLTSGCVRLLLHKVLNSAECLSGKNLKIGVVLLGGQAPGGYNVISGIMKYNYVELKLNWQFIYPYRNQGGFDMIRSGGDKIETLEQLIFLLASQDIARSASFKLGQNLSKLIKETALKLDLDGLLVIGGDDSNTNACLPAEKFRSKNLKTRVIGCPKTIDEGFEMQNLSETLTHWAMESSASLFFFL